MKYQYLKNTFKNSNRFYLDSPLIYPIHPQSNLPIPIFFRKNLQVILLSNNDKKRAMYHQIAAIICAYNEEKTIQSIIKEVVRIPIFDEIIIVNDGSKDSTGKLINSLMSEYSFKSIHLTKNKGKGFAMATAAEQCHSEILVFLDADLSNLRESHVHQLIRPLIAQKADMVIGQATETMISYKVNPFRDLSGQRAMRRNTIAPILQRMKVSGYGVETLLNMYFRANKKQISYVRLDKLFHPTKFEKKKNGPAIREFVLEGRQILKTFFINIEILIKTN